MALNGQYQNRRENAGVENGTETQGSTASLAALGLTGRTVHSADERAVIDQAVQQAAYFALFSLPNPASPPEPIPLVSFIPALAIGFTVDEGLHRFEVDEPEPSPDCGFRVRKAISDEDVARVHMQMTPMPNNFQAAADRVPPPTILLPFVSQRFCALNGSLEFLDGRGSGFRAFGCGRTFPATVNGQLEVRLAAVLDITEAFGKLAGLQGTGIVSGDTTPPSIFHFQVMFRVIDPGRRLQAYAPLPPLQSPYDPQPDTAFMPFLSEPDPDYPLTADPSSDGKQLFVKIVERLRLAHFSFDIGPPEGLRSRTTMGPIVGRHSMTLIIDLNNPGDVIPAYSKGSTFSFFDRDHNLIGGFKADLFEARVFPTEWPGLRTPILRIGGIAPPTEGNGQFKNPIGMVSVNGIFSLTSGAVSMMYMVRLSDPLGRFRSVAP
jgi:hypothetical protein